MAPATSPARTCWPDEPGHLPAPDWVTARQPLPAALTEAAGLAGADVRTVPQIVHLGRPSRSGTVLPPAGETGYLIQVMPCSPENTSPAGLHAALATFHDNCFIRDNAPTCGGAGAGHSAVRSSTCLPLSDAGPDRFKIGARIM
jgi:hypothetical protein